MIEMGVVAPPWWDDAPVAIVGTGGSLSGFDVGAIARTRAHVIAVNEAFADLPTALSFSIDRPWIEKRGPVCNATKVFAIEPDRWVAPPAPGATYLLRLRTPGLSANPSQISSGGTSGYGAMNYAFLKRARTIVLFGFDYVEGRYCPERYDGLYKPGQNGRHWTHWGHAFNDCKPQITAAGVDVINASPISSVTAFRRCTPQEGLALLGG